jgi:rhodanese-related sulfurtransferase
VGAEELAAVIEKEPGTLLLDIRKNSEYDSEHVLNAMNAPLDYINDSMSKIDKNLFYYVHCAGGYRSMIFTSILRSRGYDKLVDVRGGFTAMKATSKFAVTDYVSPTTML